MIQMVCLGKKNDTPLAKTHLTKQQHPFLVVVVVVVVVVVLLLLYL